MARTSVFASPLFEVVQLVPPLIVLKTPSTNALRVVLPVLPPAYTVNGLVGSITKASMPERKPDKDPVLMSVQLSPAFVVLNMPAPPLRPIYITPVFDGSITAAPTFEPAIPEFEALQLAPPL